MLGLNASLALICTVAATVAAPVYLPQLANLMAGAQLEIDMAALSLRLAVIVGGAAACSWLLQRYAGASVRANPHAMTGVSVVGLIVVAVGAMHGMDQQIRTDPLGALEILMLALSMNILLQIAGAALFFHGGQVRSLTIGLVSGNRNVTLVWAAATPFLAAHPGAELFLAMSVFPIFILPLAMKRSLPWVRSMAKILDRPKIAPRLVGALSRRDRPVA
jgi:hypothetical protein